MKQSQEDLSNEIIKAAIYLKQQRLTPAHTGNVSVRFEEGMLITPTGLPYDSLTEQDIVFVGQEGGWDEAGRAPSSEWQFHLAAYKANAGVHALVHTHSNYATTLACAGKHIPAFHYMVAAAGGDTIPLMPYAIFGSKELSDHVAGAFATRKACLMAHHGLLTGEKTLTKAVELTEIIEDLAQQYWAVCQLGEPTLLTGQQMQEVLEKFKTYGQQKNN